MVVEVVCVVFVVDVVVAVITAIGILVGVIIEVLNFETIRLPVFITNLSK